MSLPAIHPLLGNKAPRWADKEETQCGCDLCRHWSPLIQHVGEQLDQNGKSLFSELVNDWLEQGTDLDIAESKLAGTWPGWGWLKEEIEKRKNDL